MIELFVTMVKKTLVRLLRQGDLRYGGVSETSLDVLGKKKEFSETLPANTSSWAVAYVMLLYRQDVLTAIY